MDQMWYVSKSKGAVFDLINQIFALKKQEFKTTEMMHLLFYTALVSGAMAAISDLNCTDAGRYANSAINCQNKYPNADCENLFGNAVKVNTDTERPDKCFKNAAAAYNEPMKQLAVSICPLTCGYCCITPAYNCENKRNPRIACSTITPDMCENPVWKPIIVEDCPNVCGFCNEGMCTKWVANGFCKSSFYSDEMKKKYCGKPCGLC
ncbi:shTK domain protein [Ancylostoma duodenale]|uniref:ShTK domain protein n=1 Tax=Ancylostoma duodenale TaxID=51022 RepID=A0A0C2GYN8_9BILA|nr:shTK domain protein [Ancylostoma duodenale]